MTMFDPRTKLSSQVVEEVQRFFGDLVYDVIIPRTVRLSEAPGFGQPITVYDPHSRGAETYRQLAAEVARGRPRPSPCPSTRISPPWSFLRLLTPSHRSPPPKRIWTPLPVPTVHEVVEELEAEVEVQADATGPVGEVSPPELAGGDFRPSVAEPIPSMHPHRSGRSERPSDRAAGAAAGVGRGRRLGGLRRALPHRPTLAARARTQIFLCSSPTRTPS